MMQNYNSNVSVILYFHPKMKKFHTEYFYINYIYVGLFEK